MSIRIGIIGIGAGVGGGRVMELHLIVSTATSSRTDATFLLPFWRGVSVCAV